jgi:glycosyltransferase involved in cell wall biosynthesis
MDNFWLENSFGGAQRETQNYFLIVSTLVSYKNIDLAIEACNALKLPLKIVGEGPYNKKLQQMAGPTIEFYGYRQRDELGDLYADAKALIFPGIEDFGIAPLESMACGTPVISYRAGGPLETIVEGKTGEFFDEQTTQSLIYTLEKFDAKNFNADDCKNRAKEFSQERFERQIREAVSDLTL